MKTIFYSGFGFAFCKEYKDERSEDKKRKGKKREDKKLKGIDFLCTSITESRDCIREFVLE